VGLRSAYLKFAVGRIAAPRYRTPLLEGFFQVCRRLLRRTSPRRKIDMGDTKTDGVSGSPFYLVLALHRLFRSQYLPKLSIRLQA
jgi:hypothetical protein